MATKYCGPSGNDTTGDGSIGNPYLTFLKCYQTTTTGDTIHVLTGTTTWPSFSAGGGASVGNRTIRGDGSTLSFLDAGGVGCGWPLIGILVFEDITFRNATTSEDGGNSVFCMSSAVADVDLTCTRVRFVDIGVPATGLFRNMQGNTYAAPSALVCRFTACVFDNIYSASAGALSPIFNFSNPSTSLTVQAATLVNCTGNFDTPGTMRIGAICLLGSLCTFTVTNCILPNMSGTAMAFYKTGNAGVATVTYTDTYNWTSPPAGAGNISADPLYVDAAAGNFSLRPASPCIDTGILV